MSLRWTEKDLAAHQARRGRKVVSGVREEISLPPGHSQPPARSGGDSGHNFAQRCIKPAAVASKAPFVASKEPIVVVLPGQPLGKGRPRFTRKGHAYTPAKTRAYERALGYAGQVAMKGREPLTGPLNVTVTAIMGVPPSWSAKKRDAALVGAIWPTGRPDADNCQKVAFDGLNGICWRDDSQVVRATIEKRYGEEPKVQVEIKLMGAFDA